MWWDDWWKTEPERTGQGNSGLPRLWVVIGTLICCAALTYVVPGLEDFRPWIPGDPIPLIHFSTSDQSLAVPGEVTQALTPEQAKAQIAQTLGTDFAANLGEELGIVEDVPAVQGDVIVHPAEIEGVIKEIEDPSGLAMQHFYTALLQTKRGQGSTRICHFGDSTIAADDITYTLRRRLQRKFGDAGHGFVLLSKGTMPYRHRDVFMSGDGWRVLQMIHGSLRNRRYGLGGVAFLSSGDAVTKISTVDSGPVGTAVGRFMFFYLEHPRGGSIEWRLDRGTTQVFSTKGPEVRDKVFVVECDDGPHTLTIRALGPGLVHAYGVALERDRPGVIYDSLGMVGARAARLLNQDPEHFKEQIRLRSPDLIILQFGGNEAGDRFVDLYKYEQTLSEVVRLVRSARPESSCLLMAPLDQGEVGPRGRVRTIPTLPRIVAIQRKVAFAEGCAFFDTFSAMGGEGAMGRWYRASPRLAWGDFRHATPAGYEIIANSFYKALLKGLRDYVERPK